MKKSLLFSISFISFLSICSCSTSTKLRTERKDSIVRTSDSQSTGLVNHSEGDADFQEKANENMERIHAAFGSGLDPSDNQAPSYPDYYGGSFIDEHGKLIVYIKGDLVEGRELLSSIIGSTGFATRSCQHSYKTLVEIMSKLNAIKLNPANKSISKNFNTYALMESKNHIVVELDNYSEQEVARFKKQILNSPVIVFQKSSGRLVEE